MTNKLHTKEHINMGKILSFLKRFLTKNMPESRHCQTWFDTLVGYVSNGWELGEIHGMTHWKNVHRNAILLMQPGVNMNVVVAFAYLHDCCRLSNGNDCEHGKRASLKVDEIRNSILKDFSDEEITLLKSACLLHTDVLRTGNLTIDTCFDSDRLDLGRVGIKPMPSKMATSKGENFATDYLNFIKQRNNVGI